MTGDPAGDKAEIVGKASSPMPMPSIQVGLALGPQATAAEAFAAKLSPDQVGKIVDQGIVDSNNRHNERMASISGTKQVVFALIAGIVVIAIALILTGKPELLRDIFVFSAGAGGGYGASIARKSPERKK